MCNLSKSTVNKRRDGKRETANRLIQGGTGATLLQTLLNVGIAK